MLNSFRASWRTMCTIHSRILAGVVDHCRTIAGWMWLVLGLHALLRARGVKKSPPIMVRRFIFTAKRSDYGTGECVTLCIVAGKWADKSLCAVGATAVKSLVALHEVCGFLLWHAGSALF